ncbi:MAG: L,D-transpeptidase [bacterium]
MENFTDIPKEEKMPIQAESQFPIQNLGLESEAHTETPKEKNTSRRSFLAGIFGAGAALATGGFSSESLAGVPEVKSQEAENKLLQKIGLERSQIKPEYLKKYFEGAYKAIVIVDVSPDKQSLSAYDKDGNILIKDAEISSGRAHMETPTGSHESGKRELIHVNREGIDMPYSVAIDAERGLYVHKGSLPGFPASHGCIRVGDDDAKKIYNLAEHSKDLVIVTR